MIRPSSERMEGGSFHRSMTAPLLHESHPSLNASMEDFEARDFSPTLPELPSQHSGFRSNNASEYSEDGMSSSRRSYSPPAWRKAGSGWFANQQHPVLASPSGRGFISRESSMDIEGDDGDITAYRTARRIPLPESPVKGRSPSNSPDPVTPAAKKIDMERSELIQGAHGAQGAQEEDTPDSPVEKTPTQNNYIRFSTSLDVVQRTEPIEAVVNGVRKGLHHITRSRYNTFVYALTSLLLWWLVANLFAAPVYGPMPDLIKVAGLAKSFEPVIYYSEHGHAQIEQLQETGVAVWDLGESVRSSNMTSAPLIVNQLDALSDSLKTLAIELTRFFASVDGDIDSILLVMEWAQRELSSVSTAQPSTIGSAWSNMHAMLTRAGVLSDSQLVQDVLGLTHQQRTRRALERTFHEFLGVLEESINNELAYSMQLFALFEAIDKQFLNLQRTVIREQDAQERLESDFLSSLWTKVIGVNASKLRKYEKNRELLQSVRERTVRNKVVLVDHNQRLLQLKASLEMLRRKLVSPLVRASNSSSLSVDEQIRGLGDTYHQLKDSRDVQKRKMMELVYGAGARHVSLPGADGHARGIDGAAAMG